MTVYRSRPLSLSVSPNWADQLQPAGVSGRMWIRYLLHTCAVTRNSGRGRCPVHRFSSSCVSRSDRADSSGCVPSRSSSPQLRRDAIDAADSALPVSDVSAVEIILKWNAGKIVLSDPPRHWIKQQIAPWSLDCLSLKRADIRRASELSMHHRRPVRPAAGSSHPRRQGHDPDTPRGRDP